VRQEHGLRAADLIELRRQVLRARRLAPLVLDRLHVAAVRGRQPAPALTERAGRDDDHAVAGRAEVRDRRLHRPRAGRCEHEDVALAAVHGPQPFEALAEQGPVVGATVVDDRLGERSEHLGRDRRRTGRKEVPLLGHRNGG
jgi:hypothetical protein